MKRAEMKGHSLHISVNAHTKHNYHKNNYTRCDTVLRMRQVVTYVYYYLIIRKLLYSILTYFLYIKQEVLGRTNHILSLTHHGQHRKRRIKQFFYCCLCICCHGNVFPSRCLATRGEMCTQTQRLMEGIYEADR
jgi:hypothetical protein